MGIVEETQEPQHITFRPMSEIKGAKVVTEKDENLGKIEEVMVDADRGVIAYVVLSFGGLFGLDNKLFAIPWGSLEFNRGDYILRVDKSVFNKAEGLDENAWTLTQDELASVYKRCGIQPYWK